MHRLPHRLPHRLLNQLQLHQLLQIPQRVLALVVLKILWNHALWVTYCLKLWRFVHESSHTYIISSHTNTSEQNFFIEGRRKIAWRSKKGCSAWNKLRRVCRHVAQRYAKIRKNNFGKYQKMFVNESTDERRVRKMAKSWRPRSGFTTLSENKFFQRTSGNQNVLSILQTQALGNKM